MLEVAAVAVVLEHRPRRVREARRLQRVAHRGTILAVARGIDLGLLDQPGEAARADHATPVAFLVGPRDHVDGEMRGRRVLGQGTGDLEPVDHAHHAVEPAAAGLGIRVRADQHARARLRAAADHVADAVDLRLQPGLLHAVGQPVPALDVLRRQVGAMHAGLVAAEVGDAPQVGQESLAIDARHGNLSRDGPRPTRRWTAGGRPRGAGRPAGCRAAARCSRFRPAG